MRILSADYIFPISEPPIKEGILVFDNSGEIIEIHRPENTADISPDRIEKYKGIIVPGFVNSHCHLELSHLKGKLTRNRHLTYFISEIVEKRGADSDEINNAMYQADKAMWKEGIVAAGDISNLPDSIKVKKSGKINYHTFIELFDISEDRSELVFQQGLSLRNKFEENGLPASLSPHAPYTVTPKLLGLINNQIQKSNDLFTIHNQETESENEMFRNGTGALLQKLREISTAYGQWQKTSKSSLESILTSVKSDHTVQLVHNTFTGINDIRFANDKFENLYWCICPNANLFIENKIAPVNWMVNENCKLTIGTDSLASNDSLSIISELKTIQSFYPDISLSMLLKWSTINGAQFLKMDDRLGSFEKGKVPGINLIENVDFISMKLKKSSQVNRLA